MRQEAKGGSKANGNGNAYGKANASANERPRVLRAIAIAFALAALPGQALAQAPPQSQPGTRSAYEGDRRPTMSAPENRTPPSSGSEGSVSDYANARDPGGNSLTPQSGGITREGGPDAQSSGQSGTSTYPY